MGLSVGMFQARIWFYQFCAKFQSFDFSWTLMHRFLRWFKNCRKCVTAWSFTILLQVLFLKHHFAAVKGVIIWKKLCSFSQVFLLNDYQVTGWSWNDNILWCFLNLTRQCLEASIGMLSELCFIRLVFSWIIVFSFEKSRRSNLFSIKH